MVGNNIIVSGTASSDIIFLEGISWQPSGSGDDIFVTKFDSNGFINGPDPLEDLNHELQ